jgi:8-oxo-dGTP pyrophosphatase MutT (NUDIX family)
MAEPIKRRKVGVGLVVMEPSSPYFKEALETCDRGFEAIEPLVLMISSRRHEDKWVFPKGGWEKNETLEQTVVRGTLKQFTF